MKEKTKIDLPAYWDSWPIMHKIGWIQQAYGKNNDEEDRMEGFIEGTPEEIVRLYYELWDIVEPWLQQGYDFD